MRIIFMGTPDFAVATLEALIKAGHEVVLTVTQPDRPKGRHGELQKSDVRIAAEKHGIPVITPVRIRKDEEAKETMRWLKPDVIVVTAFGQILPKDILEMPKFGCINVHASLLPKYRGAAPIQWSILNGDTETGVTTMLMDEGLDTGDILMVKKLAIAPKETGGSLFDKLAVLGGELIVETLDALEAGTLTRTKQDGTKATKVGLFTKESGNIDWTESGIVIERKIRGLNPWPSAYTYLLGKQLKIFDADVLPEDAVGNIPAVALASSVKENGDETRNQKKIGVTANHITRADAGAGRADALPGTVYADQKALLIRTGDGVLRLNVLQLEGKTQMKAEDFLRGHRFT